MTDVDAAKELDVEKIRQRYETLIERATTVVRTADDPSLIAEAHQMRLDAERMIDLLASDSHEDDVNDGPGGKESALPLLREGPIF